MVIKLGSFAYRKLGPENVTLYQLAQAEEDGLWSNTFEIQEPAKILAFKKDTKRTQKAVTEQVTYYEQL